MRVDAMLPRGHEDLRGAPPCRGYQRAGSGYAFVLFRDGRASAIGGVGEQDGRWSAQITGSCAERTGPVADPG